MIEMTVGGLISGSAILLIAVTTIIQVSPIKVDPWTAIARAIGRAINGEVITKVDKLEKDIQCIQNISREQNAEDRRVRILHFGDEILHDIKHSKEHFDNILKDISVYEQYCKEHPEFENGRTVLTIETIEETYKKCFDNHTFL